MKQQMVEWLKAHRACGPGFRWAEASCSSLREVWDTARPDWLVWVATRPGAMSERDQHRFGLWAAMQVEHLMTDPRSIAALRAKAAWLEGAISGEDLADARRAAAAAYASSSSAAAAAYAAASDAAAEAAASAYAAASADAAAYAYASADARQAQAEWIRANCAPLFLTKSEGKK